MECRIFKKASQDLFAKCTYFYVSFLAYGAMSETVFPCHILYNGEE